MHDPSLDAHHCWEAGENAPLQLATEAASTLPQLASEEVNL